MVARLPERRRRALERLAGRFVVPRPEEALAFGFLPAAGAESVGGKIPSLSPLGLDPRPRRLETGVLRRFARRRGVRCSGRRGRAGAPGLGGTVGRSNGGSSIRSRLPLARRDESRADGLFDGGAGRRRESPGAGRELSAEPRGKAAAAEAAPGGGPAALGRAAETLADG